MYRLLVVDDEPIIADGLYERFVEMKLPQLEVYKAYSGTEALAWLNRRKMDVVITDICMPGMNGLALLDRIRGNWPKCRVIFLTGHDRFDYVYKAIQHSGVSYLLKSEGYDAITDLTRTYLEEVRQSNRDEELLTKAQNQWQRSLPLLQREFLCELAEGTGSPADQAQLEELAIPMQASQPVFLLTGYAGDTQRREGRAGKADFGNAHLIVENHLSPHAELIGAPYRGHMLWLLQLRPGDGRAWEASPQETAVYLKGLLESVQAVCMETFGLCISFALSGGAVSWDAVAEEFAAHRAMLASAWRTEQEAVLLDTGRPGSAPAEPAGMKERLKRKLKKVETLQTYLEQGRRDDFLATLTDIESALMGQLNSDTLYYETFYSLSVMFLSYFNSRGSADAAPPAADIGRLTHIGSFASPRQAFEHFAQVADTIFSQQNAEQENRAAVAIQRVQRYIQDNPGGDLSLSSLADLVYFNPKYLSRLFKQVSGVNLSDYILNVRLNKVRELLRDSTMKVHEIAEYIGYFSAPCFTRFFKKAMGMTPQEYRDARL